jgi:alpha-L-fucosidase
MSDRLEWFRNARFGMFIHWGAYAAAGRGEMVHAMHGLSKDEYDRQCVQRFKAQHYDPAAWAALARRAGCRYMVLTTKHNDGFCLFNTKTTDWNAVQRGPRRDLVAPYVKACRAAGLKVGLYFSLHDYWQAGGVPRHYNPVDRQQHTPRAYAAYYDFVRAQLRELCTNYGRIDMLFYDGGLPEDPRGKHGRAITALVRRLQPQIVVNNRDNNPNDYDTPENRFVPSPSGRPWEVCMTLAPQWWGYHRTDGPFKTVGELCWLLQQTASHGGNLLLNVGPRADGVIPVGQSRLLEGMGRWLKANAGGEAIYGSRRGFNVLSTCGAPTTVGNRLYIHAFRHEAPECVFRALLSRVTRITCLATGKPVRFEQQGDVVRMLGLPRRAPAPVATVYRVEVAGPLKTAFH